jgi:hypothetical protein
MQDSTINYEWEFATNGMVLSKIIYEILVNSEAVK